MKKLDLKNYHKVHSPRPQTELEKYADQQTRNTIFGMVGFIAVVMGFLAVLAVTVA